jgi:ABC-type uncharacterized transport system fused permease/ATPase subunit
VTSKYNKKLTLGLGIISIVIIVTMPGMVIDIIKQLIHFVSELLFELGFLCFEALESSLDHIVEELFHTELKETQSIVFYLMVVIALVPLYLLWRILPRFYLWLTKKLLRTWLRISSYWRNLSLFNKIKVVTISLTCIYLALFVFS